MLSFVGISWNKLSAQRIIIGVHQCGSNLPRCHSNWSIEYNPKIIPAQWLVSLVSKSRVNTLINPDLPRTLYSSDSHTALDQSLKSDVRYVKTIAAQLRSHRSVKNLMRQHEHAHGFLLVSGSSKLRQLVPHYLRPLDSVKLLEIASLMRESGDLNADIELWAVANPNSKDLHFELARLELKINAGATCIVTQPCLDEEACAKFWNEVSQRKLLQKVRFHVGIPVLVSQNVAQKWIQLVGMDPSLEASKNLMERVRFSGSESANAEWIRAIDFVRTHLADISNPGTKHGLHLMPLLAWRRIPKLLDLV